MSDEDERLRKLERDVAVHEAVCAERYKGIMLRLNVVMALLLTLVGAAAMGNPVVAAVRQILGGG
jgi:hypothetical protein